MKLFCAVADTGRVIFAAQCQTEAEADDVRASAGLADDLVEMPLSLSPLTHWRDGDAWAVRPVPPAPPALVAGVAATWAGLPVGAVVMAFSRLTGAYAGSDTADASGEVEIRLAAGLWRVAVNEVFPCRAASFDIEVPEA